MGQRNVRFLAEVKPWSIWHDSEVILGSSWWCPLRPRRRGGGDAGDRDNQPFPIQMPVRMRHQPPEAALAQQVGDAVVWSMCLPTERSACSVVRRGQVLAGSAG